MEDRGEIPLMSSYSNTKTNPVFDYGTVNNQTGGMAYPLSAFGDQSYNSYNQPSDPSYQIGFNVGERHPPFPANPSDVNPTYNEGVYPPPVHHTSHQQETPNVGFEGMPSHTVSPISPLPMEDNTERVTSPKRLVNRTRNKVDIKDNREMLPDGNSTMFRDGRRKIDYIIAYEPFDQDVQRQKNRASKREMFENNLKALGLQLEREDVENSCDGKTVFIKVHIPWDLLCQKAEELQMKMPLKVQIDFKKTTTVYMRITDNSTDVSVDPDGIIIIKENEMDIRTAYEKFLETICCYNPFALHDAELPEELDCYTCAFRVDWMDKFKVPDNKEDFFSSAQRSRVVHRMLMTCRYDDRKHYQMGISRLISNGSYSAAYPLHAGSYKLEESNLTHSNHTHRQLLYLHWARPARWFKEQPLDLIRTYFGEKIGLYFTWLGYYTGMLVPAAIVGLVVIIYGLATMNSYMPIVDLCENKLNLPMCPKCDKNCEYTSLADSCSYTMVTYILDNPFTVVFAMFMSLWATFFLEFWKRKEAEVQYDWDLIGFQDEEEQPRPEFEAAVPTLRLNPITQLEEPYVPNSRVCPRYAVAFNCVILMIVLVVLAIFSVLVYRIAVYSTIAATSSLDIAWFSLISSSTAAIINLIAIMVLNKLYEKLAYTLTAWEMPKTQTMFDDLFTFKMYLFQFVNFYGSLFYIAFGKLNPGTPKNYTRWFNYRTEECNPAGCLFELGLQLFVIMVGKQLFNNTIEIIIPKIKKWWRSRDNARMKDMSKLSQWEKDYDLVETSQQGLFYEYLEMVIQYGFITIFVAAFPLGPFFALINNLIEIRVDAYKYVAVFRRHYSERVQNIGIWYEILTSIAKFSVVVNAFVIGFVTEFVPRIYYELTTSNSEGLEGFLNFTLSCFDINDFEGDKKPTKPFNFPNGSCGFGKQSCRYRGYYEPPYKWGENGTIMRNERRYDYSHVHWHIIAGKLFFVIVFEHLIFAIAGIIAWIIPDVPAKLDQKIKRENYLAKMAARGDSDNTSNTGTLHMEVY